ncbi:peptidase, M16 family protein [Algoriphagus oliviformis]|uniref:peptidase, M16 family protein n=1 Tax=Algoriphagus oliviformis TaxID=2811231 RepID=UPI001F2BCCF3|nr:peptidase, M16 family protein [Algoriphagus oliviformis]
MKIRSIALLGLLGLGLSTQIQAEKVPTPAEHRAVVKNDVATVVAKYLEALGGVDKIKNIKNATMTAEASFQGQVIEIKTISDAENSRLMQSMAVGGNVMQKTVLVDGKGQMMMMGQTQELPESAAGMLNSQTFLIPELYYEEIGFKSVYVGLEDMEGTQVHKLEVTSPEGMVINEYYSVESGLKLKSSSGNSGDVFYSDYQEVDGIKFPMLLTIKNPMLPIPLEAKIVSLRFNQSLTDADFQ